jgi:MFS family permease
MLGVYTIVQSSEYGLGSVRTIALAVVTFALLGAFVARQAMGRNPILPLRMFRSLTVSGANVVQALMSTAFLSFFFMGSLDMQRVLGYGPMTIGLAFLPVAVVMGVFSFRFSAPLITRFGPYAMLVTGLVILGAALAVLGFGPTNPNYFVHLMIPLALLGLGGGLVFPSVTMIAMADVAPNDAGLASGLLNTTGQIGGALGLAVLATVANARTINLAQSGSGGAAALAGGYHLSWLVGAATVVVTLAVAAWALRPRSFEASEPALAEGEAAA